MGSDSVRYERVFRLPGKVWGILLSESFEWGLCQEGRFRPFATPKDCMPLLPLLELAYTEVEALIGRGLEQVRRSPARSMSFPYDDLLHLALSWPSDYWPSLAIRWFEEGYPISERLLEHLRALRDNELLSQRLRHRAGKLG